MLRKFLLPALAATTLAGCATGYSYRGGSGDYYYGQPQVEYRYYGPSMYGGYGGYYGNGLYGGIGFGYPFGYGGYYGGGYWNSPYGGYPYWSRPRPPRPPHGHGGDHGGHDNNGHDGDRDDGRKPPWRDFGGVLPPSRERAEMPDRNDVRPRARRAQMPSSMPMMPAPQRESRSIAPSAPRMQGSLGGGSPMGRAIRNAKSSPALDE